jgi:CRP-like cAMP-binding protein
MTPRFDRVPSNRILAAVPAETLERLKALLEPVELSTGQVIYHHERPIEWSYFITAGLVSLVRIMGDGRTAEVGAIGIEGVTGPDALFGIPDAILECIVQVPGTALRMRPEALRKEMLRSPELHGFIARFVQSIINQIAQTAACNRLHSLEERCCRWLLTAHDSAGADSFAITHEFLATILGVQRAGVSLKVSAFQKDGLIRYSRGHMEILDRQRILAATCECYGTIRRQIDLVFDRKS